MKIPFFVILTEREGLARFANIVLTRYASVSYGNQQNDGTVIAFH
jgi:hypothetical protein